MENIVPKCTNNNTCIIVCNVKKCKIPPFMCADVQCYCYSLHQKCISSIKWKGMKQLFSNKLKKSSSKLNDYFTQINELYKDILKQIEKSFSQFKNISASFGLSQLEQEFYQRLKQKKYDQLNGQLINKLELELAHQNKQFQIRSIEKQKQKIQKKTVDLIEMLDDLGKLKKKEGKKSIIPKKQSEITLNSKIVEDFEMIQRIFVNKKIIGIELLYNAFENNFQAKKFHEICDGKQNTLTLVKTEFGNVIGGYTSLPWNKGLKDKFSVDTGKQSFIFSITNKHKLNLIEGKQSRAIVNDYTYGPTFGGGHDLYIADKANQNANSYARPGYSYNNGEYISGSQQSWKKFSGQSKGSNFKVLQWQVYSIVLE